MFIIILMVFDHELLLHKIIPFVNHTTLFSLIHWKMNKKLSFWNLLWRVKKCCLIIFIHLCEKFEHLFILKKYLIFIVLQKCSCLFNVLRKSKIFEKSKSKEIIEQSNMFYIFFNQLYLFFLMIYLSYRWSRLGFPTLYGIYCLNIELFWNIMRLFVL